MDEELDPEDLLWVVMSLNDSQGLILPLVFSLKKMLQIQRSPKLNKIGDAIAIIVKKVPTTWGHVESALSARGMVTGQPAYEYPRHNPGYRA